MSGPDFLYLQVLWVKQDQNHSWRHFKSLARKIPGVRIEFVQSPSLSKEYSKNCYEKISDNVVTPIIEFVTGTKLENVEQELRKGKELVTKSTVGDPVVEICTINFEDDFSPDDLEKMLSPSNGEAEVRAVELFQVSHSNI